MRDDEGAIQVVEAVLAALLIISALVFISLIQRPAPPPVTTGGLDLSEVAADALRTLQGPNPGNEAPAAGQVDRLQVAVGQHLGGNDTLLRSELARVLPPDLRFQATIRPPASASFTVVGWHATSAAFNEPRNAQGAVAYVFPSGNPRAVELVVWLGF